MRESGQASGHAGEGSRRPAVTARVLRFGIAYRKVTFLLNCQAFISNNDPHTPSSRSRGYAVQRVSKWGRCLVSLSGQAYTRWAVRRNILAMTDCPGERGDGV